MNDYKKDYWLQTENTYNESFINWGLRITMLVVMN